MDSQEAYDQYDDEQKESSSYKTIMISGIVLLVIIAFIAAVRV
jgi:hypothetical protein